MIAHRDSYAANALPYLLIQAHLQPHIALSTYLQLLIVLPAFLVHKTPDTHILFAAYLVDNPFFSPLRHHTANFPMTTPVSQLITSPFVLVLLSKHCVPSLQPVYIHTVYGQFRMGGRAMM